MDQATPRELQKEMDLFNQYQEKRLFAGLDGLRFLSIIGVIWHHSVSHSESMPFLNLGFLGVDLFFVISGYLIVTLLLRERQRSGDISLRSFYIRRALRIFPLYFAVVLGLAAAYKFLAPGTESGQRFLSELPIYLLYLANWYPVSFGILWSLSAEEQFYMIWPTIEKHLRRWLMPILAIALVINQILNFNHNAITEWLGVQNLSIHQITFTPILLGVLLAHLLHKPETFSRLQRLVGHRWSSALWLLVLTVIIIVSPQDISGFPRLFMQLAMMMLVGSVVINKAAILVPVLEFKPIARIGVVSYGLYIFHIHSIIAAEKILNKALPNGYPEFFLFIVGFLITYIIAELSYRFFEKPFLSLKSKFSVVHQKHA